MKTSSHIEGVQMEIPLCFLETLMRTRNLCCKYCDKGNCQHKNYSAEINVTDIQQCQHETPAGKI